MKKKKKRRRRRRRKGTDDDVVVVIDGVAEEVVDAGAYGYGKRVGRK